MASDSDLEAYLNQLSKKTHSLKQDVNALGYGSSRPTSAEDKSSDALDLSDEHEKGDSPSRRTRKTGQLVTTSDITALSDKYGRTNIKKSSPYDEFSSLEKKYLKKSPKKNTHKIDSLGECLKERDYETSRVLDRNHAAGHLLRAKDVDEDVSRSCDSSVDEELARYLNESSLVDSPKEVKQRLVTVKSASPSSSSMAESNDIVNFNNIMTVDDIIGQITNDYDRVMTEDGDNSDDNIDEQLEFSEELSEVGLHHSFEENEMSHRKQSVTRKKSLSEAKDKDGPSYMKSLNEAKDEDVPSPSKEDISGSSKEVIKKLLRKTSVSLFYPDTEVEAEDRSIEKLDGVLFTEIPNNLFHSSRRNSLMTPLIRRKSSSKSLLSISIQDQADENSSEEDSTDQSDAESVVENLSPPYESSVAESVSEKKSSEKVGGECSEDFKDSHSRKPARKNIIKFKSSNSDLFKSDILIEPDKLSSDAGKRRSLSEQSHLGAGSSIGEMKKEAQDKDLVASNIVGSGKKDKKHHKSKESSIVGNEKEEKNHHKSHKKMVRSDTRSRRKVRRKGKRKQRYRSPSSELSSSSSNSSSSYSSNSAESQWSTHTKFSRKKHRHRKHQYNSWNGNPYMNPWWWMHTQPPSFLAGPDPNHFPHPRPLEGWMPSGGILGVDDIMRQQVALTRQFMDSQQALYHAYTATLTSSYRYTSLKDTEKYIKKKKHPLTFDEAYRLVREEMKASKKKGLD